MSDMKKTARQVPDGVYAALKRITQRSVVYDLSHTVSNDMPVFFQHVPYNLTMNRRFEDPFDPPRINESAFVNEVIVTSAHVGTHIDALGHFANHGCVHGGRVAQSIESRDGLTDLDAEQIAPIFCRAIVLDIPRVRGVGCLDASSEVTTADVQAALNLAGTRVQPGDAILFRTGWAQHWADHDVYTGSKSNNGGAPGPGTDAAAWLLDQGAGLMGSDTPGFECLPSPGGSVHSLLLVDHSVHIIENLDLEEAAAAGSLMLTLIAIPLPLHGSSASPIRALGLTG